MDIFSFEDLSFDILSQIALKLDIFDLKKLSTLNGNLVIKLLNNENLWRERYIQVFGIPDELPYDELLHDWQSLFFTKLYVQGNNDAGQLGTNIDDRIGFMENFDIDNPFKVATGIEHSLVLDLEGHVHVFGVNDEGQLGLGEITEPVDFPEKNPYLTNIKDVFAFGDTSFALDKNGDYYIFGMATPGLSKTSYLIPTKIPELTGSKKFVSFSGAFLNLTKDGTVYAIGSNLYGRLGIDIQYSVDELTLVKNLPKIKDIALGEFWGYFLTQDGEVYASGTRDILRSSTFVFGKTRFKNIKKIFADREKIYFITNENDFYEYNFYENERKYSQVGHYIDEPKFLMGNVKDYFFSGGSELLLTYDGDIYGRGFNLNYELSPAPNIKLFRKFGLLPHLNNILKISIGGPYKDAFSLFIKYE